MSLVVDAPGVYLDVPDDVYHSDTGAVSSTGLRKLLPPSTPAHFRHYIDHGQAPKAAYDLGHAVHREILGEGADIAVPSDGDDVPFEEWRTKEAKAEVARIRAAGQVPVKADAMDRVRAMTTAVREHETAGPLMDRGRVPDAQAELSMWWQDPGTGVWCRSRFDLLTRDADGRLIGVDVKSTDDASPYAFAKSVGSYRYDQQAAHYLAGCAVLDPGTPVGFVFVAVEKEPPYGVGLYELRDDDLAAAHERNGRALRVYAECVASGVWPSYSVEVEPLDLPRWVTA